MLHSKEIKKTTFNNLNKRDIVNYYINDYQKMPSDDGRNIDWGHNPNHILIDNTKVNLDFSHFVFKHKNVMHELPKKLKDLADKNIEEFLKKQRFFVSEIIRVSDVTFDGKTFTIHTQKTTYDKFIGTNGTMDLLLDTENTSLREKEHPYGILPELRDSSLANTLGISIMVTTKDNYLILPRRSQKVTTDKGNYSPSASGVVDVIDINNGKEFESDAERSFYDLSIEREIEEELGIKKEELSNIEFLGMTRDLIKGGKPEIHFETTTKLTHLEVKERWEKALDKNENKDLTFYYIPINESRSEFIKRTNQLLKEIKNHLSAGLLMSLMFVVTKRLNEIEKTRFY